MQFSLPPLVLAAAYLALGAGYGWILRRQEPWSRRSLRALTVLLAAAHLWLLADVVPQGASLLLGFGNAVSLLAALVMLLFGGLSSVRAVDNLGVVLAPLAALSVLLMMLPSHAAPLPIVDALPLALHILLSVLAYGLLALAALQALFMAYQDSRLRQHTPGGLLRALPPLGDMEQLLFQILALGFAALTLALLSGMLFLGDIFAPHLIEKTALSICAWLVIGTLLIGRRRAGWRGQTAVRWTLAGFALLMLAYLGSKFALEFLLQQTR
ncbi:inner membrane protein YpjD [Immundisolibacter sp.]|uniref:cytochrome C assembly family protein n=1 Tax=Immundisolibacter sp. TaxID=1934948 RepID=UPI0035637853